MAAMNNHRTRIYHVGSRDTLQKLRDDILRLHGFEVVSTLSLAQVIPDVSKGGYDLVLIDVEGDNRVPLAEQLCSDIKDSVPGQAVAYVCNYRVSIDSSCPDEVIRAEFNPEALVNSVREMLEFKSPTASGPEVAQE
jgi:hypothetical protein